MKKVFLVSIDTKLVRIFHDGEHEPVVIESDSVDPSDIGATIALGLKEVGFRNDKLILGLMSRQVYFVKTDFDRNAVQNRTAIKYALEEHLPFDAEQMIPLTVGTRPNQSTIVLESSSIRDLLECLGEEHGIAFDSIIPIRLMMSSQLSREKHIPGTCQLLIAGKEASDMLTFENGILVAWKYVSGDVSKHDWMVDGSEEHASDWTVLCDANVDRSEFEAVNATTVLDATIDECTHNAVIAFDKIGNDVDFDFVESVKSEFGIGNSGASLRDMACFSLLVCILCFAAAFGYQTYRWNQQAIRLDDSMRKEFRDTMPGKRINGPVKRLLESELLKQRASNDLISYSNSSAELLLNLESFLTSLPSDIRFRFESITIHRDTVQLTGEVKTLQDLDLLKDAFVDGGFKIETQSTYKNPFSLILTCRTDQIGSNLGAAKP